ncbi:MAG: OmpA family protein [Formosimonas sp.]|jgi:OOP family OmpA-OmpF porin
MKISLLRVVISATLAMAAFGTHAAEDADIKWPAPESAVPKNGTFVNVEQLRRIGPAMNKDQVRELISYPQFNEGFFHPRSWNYLFNFRTGQDYEYVTCQYQIRFDKNENVESMHWRTAECAQYLDATPVVIQSHPITMSTDGLFAFGKSGWDDLQMSGRENLTNLASQIKTGYSNLRAIDIIGHTDRIGSASANMRLSLARANTVKQYLVSQGVEGRVIRTQGVGSNSPVAFCSGSTSPTVIACLAPNRRIEISVTGDK